MKVVISNFSEPIRKRFDFRSYWSGHVMPQKRERVSLFEQEVDWGFHIYALGVYLLDNGLAKEVEFWDYSDERKAEYLSNGILKVTFFNELDILAYMERYGHPDLFINYGRDGHTILPYLAGRCFRVHVPCSRVGIKRKENYGAECYLVDSEEYLDDRSMMYIPVVNLRKIYPVDCEKKRDFIYLAACYRGKMHDLLIKAVRGTELTGHLHPVDGSKLKLSNTKITTTGWNEADVVELLRTSRMAVYPGDETSNPAAMWECVAADLPIVVNQEIEGGKHLVIPGVTGEVASAKKFYEVMKRVLANLDSYTPRQYFEEHWDTVTSLERYLAFFAEMGWKY